MNSAALHAQGSIQDPNPTFEPTASHHWACGMPLSYVLETASRWLNEREQPTLFARLTDPATSKLHSSAE